MPQTKKGRQPREELPPAGLTEDVTTRISPQMKERLRRLALLRDRSESWILRTALRDYLDREEE